MAIVREKASFLGQISMLQRSDPRKLSSVAVTLLTETAIYRFCVAFAVFAFVADTISFVGQSDYNVVIKYIYASIIMLLIFMSFWRWGSFDASSLAPVLAMAFFFIFGGGFLVNLVFYGVKVSYVTAFTSSLIFAAAAFVPSGAVVFDGRRILKQLLLLFSFGTVCYLVEILLKFAGDFGQNYVYFRDIEPTKPVVCVLAICLSILLDRKFHASVLIAITAVTLVLRPTSSVLILLVVCGVLAVALRIRAVGTARLMAYGIFIVAAVAPLALYFFLDDIGQIVQQVESYIKVDLLGGQSDTAFRLTILKYAFQALDQSFLFGNKLSGVTAVLLAREYTWWLDVTGGGEAEIHSDFVIVLTQAGFVGYMLFVWFFYSMLSVRFRMLARSTSYGEEFRTLTALSVIAVIVLIIDCSANPFLQVFQTVHPIWMLLFISEVARKSIPMPKLASRVDHRPAIKFKFAR
jgi:hypothetical protein